MFYTYILKSEKNGALYKGHTENLQTRLNYHNSGKVKSTKAHIPWQIVYFEEFDIREGAIAREKYFKTAAGRRFIDKLSI
ncbi:GIY-YIG nuclease family protein [Fulvivirga sp.]